MTFDQKAKFIVKEMENMHNDDWACIVEPLKKFVQCFGVSKRPDQYIRYQFGEDRIRVWRLNDHNPDIQKPDPNELLQSVKLQ